MFRKLRTKKRVPMKHNVTYRLRDKDGNLKPMFQPNAMFSWLIKHGYLSPHAPKIPFLFGRWTKGVRAANLVVDAGKAGVASRINGAGGEAVFDYIALGTGTTAVASGDTALQTETHREQATASRTTTDVTDDTATLVNTFNFSSSFAITESGVLNAATAGTLLARQVFSAINVANGDSLETTWDIDVD